jgi:splicing factor 45
MGLFEDLPDATDAGGKKVEGTSAKTPGKDGSAVAAAGGWSGAGSKLRAPTRRPPTSLPSAHALKAQAAALRAQQAKKRASLASNAEADAEASGEDDRGASLATADDAAEDDTAKHAGTWGTMSAAIEDEYVPSRPNSYEALAKTRAETRAREEIETAREARRLVLEGQRAARAALRRAVSGGTGGLYSGRDRRELDVTGEEAFARRATLGAHGARVGDGTSESSGTEGADRSAAASGGGGESLAMKMMKKMGYVEGRGLGKNDQGMTTPLEVRKDSARSGIIVNAPEKPHEGA